MGSPRFSVPPRIYERGNVDSGYKANSYIGYFYRYSTGGWGGRGRKALSMGPEIGSSVSGIAPFKRR